MVREYLRKAISAIRLEMPFIIEAFVLLPDQLHCMWILPKVDCEYGKSWGKNLNLPEDDGQE